jgi:hypothetical protein
MHSTISTQLEYHTAVKNSLISSSKLWKGGYIPKQVFNLNETSLLWKQMASCTFISIKEEITPGFKAAKGQCMLTLGGNTSMDYKLRCLMVYYSQNPWALKGYIKQDCVLYRG